MMESWWGGTMIETVSNIASSKVDRFPRSIHNILRPRFDSAESSGGRELCLRGIIEKAIYITGI